MQIQKNLMVRNARSFCLLSSLIISFGILLVTIGGSWDITNHLLNKPETFFSLPHIFMYGGVATSLFGTVFLFFSWRYLTQDKGVLVLPVRMSFLGIMVLVSSGPFDYLWHSNFGLDGLLSPPHFCLLSGMVITAIGGFVAITRIRVFFSKSNNFKFLYVLGILPIWISSSGIIHSLSLPFSRTDYFDFNPNPLMGVIIATCAYPFLIGLFLPMVSRLANYRFGIMSIAGVLFLIIYSSTAIIPNFAMTETILFYSLNLIPIVSADALFSLFGNRKKISYIIPAILGSVFYMIYYPYIMYTYNQYLLGKLVSPSMIFFVYFEMIDQVFILTVLPAILFAILGSYFSHMLTRFVLANQNR